MKYIFLDTNIVVDFLADPKPFSAFAAKLFNFETPPYKSFSIKYSHPSYAMINQQYCCKDIPRLGFAASLQRF